MPERGTGAPGELGRLIDLARRGERDQGVAQQFLELHGAPVFLVAHQLPPLPKPRNSWQSSDIMSGVHGGS